MTTDTQRHRQFAASWLEDFPTRPRHELVGVVERYGNLKHPTLGQTLLFRGVVRLLVARNLFGEPVSSDQHDDEETNEAWRTV